MTDRSRRDTEYILIRNRKPKKTKRYYFEEDGGGGDDDDDESQIFNSSTRRLAQAKPPREQRIKYISSDEIDSGYRRRSRVTESSDRRIQVRKKPSSERVILDDYDDDDENIIKVIRNRRTRTRTPSPVEDRRLERRPRESQSIYYETMDNHIARRPPKKNLIQTKKSQVVYADDEPVKVLKRVIIDPRTGDRETLYEKDRPRRQQKYYTRQHPAELSIDSDEDEDEQQPQYVKVVKHRNIPTEVLPRHEPSNKYVMIRKNNNSEPVYARTSKMPAIKNNRRVVYEVPTKKSLTTYVYSTDGKYYK